MTVEERDALIQECALEKTAEYVKGDITFTKLAVYKTWLGFAKALIIVD